MKKPEVLIESISNGLGSQSMFLMLLASKGIIPARISITADTGSELDCLWNNGRRTSAKIYFNEVVAPFASKYSLDARFVQAVRKDKIPLPSIIEHTKSMIASGKLNGIKIPLFGSKGGRLGQSCTGRWKIEAIKQEARRMGATRLITVQGIHFAEAGRRVKGIKLPNPHGEWTLYQDTRIRKVDGIKTEIPVLWCQHYYPMVDRGYGRITAQKALEAEKIPYLISSQCDCCPHNDLDRWLRHTPEVLIEIASVEASMKGKFFFTDERIPLIEAIAVKSAKPKSTLDPTFGCEGSYCGV
jgi:hypothetical protein